MSAVVDVNRDKELIESEARGGAVKNTLHSAITIIHWVGPQSHLVMGPLVFSVLVFLEMHSANGI